MSLSAAADAAISTAPSGTVITIKPAEIARQLIPMLGWPDDVTLFHHDDEGQRAGVVVKPIAKVAAAVREAMELAGERHVFAALTGVRRAFKDKTVLDGAPAVDTASYAMRGPDGGIHLIHLADSEEGLAELLERLGKDMTEDACISADVPLPYGNYTLHEDDAARLVSGEDFDVLSVDAIKAAIFGGSDDDGDGERSAESVLFDDTLVQTGTWNDAEVYGELSAEAFVDGSEYGFWPGAKVYGVFPDGILDTIIGFATARRLFTMKNQNRRDTLRGAYHMLSRHRVGTKEGQSFIGCTFSIDPGTQLLRRLAENVVLVYWLVFDFDSGQSAAEAAERFRRRAKGKTALQYSSHSNKKLLEDGSVGPEKHRLVIPLLTPFDPSKYENPKAVFSATYLAAADFFGFDCDPKCKDLPHGFHGPRHPEGGEFFVNVFAGDLFELPIVMPEDRPMAKIARKKGVALSYDVTGEAYVPGGSGVEFFRSLIGDGPDQLGYHGPIYRTICSCLHPSNGGPDADAGPIVRLLRDTIEKAVKGPGRAGSDIVRYMSDEYLTAQIASARIFIRGQIETKEAAEAAEKENFDALVAGYRASPDPKKLDIIGEELASIGRPSLTAYVRGILAAPGAGKLAVSAFDAVMKPLEVEHRERRREEAKGAATRTSEKPLVYKTEHFDVQCQLVQHGLKLANETSPHLFETDGVAKRLIKKADGKHTTEEMSWPQFKNAMNNAVVCIDDSDGRESSRRASLPEDVCSHLFGAAEFPYLLPLDRIVHTPIHSRNGTLRAEVGYDPETTCYIDLGNLHIPEVPEIPDDDDLARARDLILGNMLFDFPFSDAFGREIVNSDGNAIDDSGDGSRANAVAAVLQHFVQGLYSGATPAYLIGKPTAGTGSGYLADTTSMVSAGRRASPLALPKQEDEIEKRLTGVLIEGRAIVMFDNVTGRISSPALAAFLTAGDSFSGRRLGSSEMLDLKKRCTVIVTGNGLELDGEQRRRFVPIYLDAKTDKPGDRDPDAFRQPKLHDYMERNRGELVWACLTIVQNWFAKGQPSGTVILATFEAYCRVMGGILDAAGIDGFLSNVGLFRESQADGAGDGDDDTLFMQALYDEASRRKLLEKGFTGEIANEVAFRGDVAQFACLNIDPFERDKEGVLKRWLSRGTTLKTYRLEIDGEPKLMRFMRATPQPVTKRARWKFVPAE
ncbi:hypothetical protein ABGN05_20000 [Aquibium sp. LZ166]|uniref:Uncharacterized protein n=1 Tax=Aquibium pacificus TaxID=3153579 RepID=A0ABV3SQY2_9HYPH